MGEKRTFSIMLGHMIRLTLLVSIGFWLVESVRSAPIAIENNSFEAPVVDPNGFAAVPFVDGWTEIDLDTQAGSNTGVFANTPPGSEDHVVNADGNQLAFLGSESGNSLEQELNDTYRAACEYRLTVGVGISALFPPSQTEPADGLKLVLFYRDGNDVVDIASRTVEAAGLSSTELTDFGLYLPAVGSGDAWAGKTIGVALRAAGMPGGFWDLDNVRLDESVPAAIAIENASFEAPFVDPNAFPALPLVEGWTEKDNDTEGSTNTGVFANTPGGKTDHIANPDGRQLVFLGSESGNGLEQELGADYKAGCSYRLTAAVGISSRFPPSTEEPVDTLELALFYRDENGDIVDVAREIIDSIGISPKRLVDFSVHLPTVESDDAWAGRNIGVAFRAAGMPGGFWDLDDVRLSESLPVCVPVENGSFELPRIDPNGFGAVPLVDGWTELDTDTLSSSNTGVFANTAEGSDDHVVNADGSQLAFLGSESGNAIEQDLGGVYETGCSYRLTAGVGISERFPPSSVEPADAIELVFFYRGDDGAVDIAAKTVDAAGLASTRLGDFSLYLPTVEADDVWAGRSIGVAIRAAGMPGGFWDLDNIRLAKTSVDIDSYSAAVE
jgi:hypothetical protein